jgi:rhamnogalacturonyl hydrolase YesR
MTRTHRSRLVRAAACALLLGVASSAHAFWGPFEAGKDPRVLGQKIVDDLLARDFDARYAQRGGMSYPEVCTAYGCLRFVGETGDKARLAKLVKRYDIIFTDAGRYLITRPNNVDNSLFGVLAMEIHRQIEKAGPGSGIPADKKWLDLGKPFADAQWTIPTAGGAGGTGGGDARPFAARPNQEAVAKGFSWQTRYWIDDMFMIPALQTEAFRVTKDPKYLDRTAKEMVAYFERLQKDNGLFFHHEDSPFYWGRGNGWMAAGAAELLSELPADHPQRPAILDGYKKMMAGLLKYQGKDGMWKQLIDKENSWSETSGTGMFVFGMAMGVRNGWLDEATYKEPTIKAWNALASYVNDKGEVREVCEGTNKGTSEAYYNDRARRVGDFHGQAGFIWAAWAMTQ